MSRSNLSHLVLDDDHELPLIPRVHEVASAEEIRDQDYRVEVVAASLAAEPEAPAPQPAVPAIEPEPVGEPLEEGGMPFIGRVLAYAPSESIIVQRTLTLAEDLYLADHAFVNAAGAKPMSACMPVVPMTMSLEAMAEVAACLAPGLGLIGFEDVRATRWIELVDSASLVLTISAHVQERDAERQVWRIAVGIQPEGQKVPSITATVLFAAAYRVDCEPAFSEFSNPYRLPITGEDLYRQHIMFHGPRFHCVTGDMVMADRGAVGELLVRSPTDLFSSVRQPQLLTDPSLLDCVGQLIGVWAMQSDSYVFPIGFRKLEIYRPAPPVGTRVPCRIEITRDEAKTLYADIEVQDGAGGVWMRIQEWGKWKFHYPRRLVDFRRQPTQHLISRTLELPLQAPRVLSCMVTKADLSGFDAPLLARHYLHTGEMPAFEAKAGVRLRQQQWLLGRVAAKDAVRAWIAACEDTRDMLHPAALAIDNDAVGQPVVTPLEGHPRVPHISISHCEDRAVAVAGEREVGIDIEKIRRHADGFLESFTTAGERELLGDLVRDGEKRDDWATRLWSAEEWVTRLWSAKEAAGKLLGTGVDSAPQRFEAIAIDAGGDFVIQVRGGDRLIGVHSVRDGDFVIAYAATETTGASGK